MLLILMCTPLYLVRFVSFFNSIVTDIDIFLFVSGKETEFPIEPELTLELMMAANYLHTWNM